MGIASAIGAFLTIVGPVIAAALVVWLEERQEKHTHATMDTVDEHLKTHLEGDRTSRMWLARELERLQREARRKLRHP